ncbi:MAG: type IV pilin protein [Rubrivivax sp.]|nr:type IV pilin protein [Rubrivivax sp.]
MNPLPRDTPARAPTVRAPRHRPAQAGFTLIELMVTVAIVGILAAVAYPSYSEHVVRTRRALAAGCATELATFAERVYASNLRYDQNAGVATALPAVACRTELIGTYTFAFAAGQPTATTFTIEAAPAGAQAAKDTKCATLSIDQANTKGHSGTAPTVAECWK